MQCAICGFAQPGPAASCPACGRAFVTAPSGARVAPPAAGRGGTARIIVCAAVVFGAGRVFGFLYASYLVAEQERVEAILLGQILEHKKLAQEAAQELEAVGEVEMGR